MTGNSLSRVADIALPALSGSQVMYNAQNNIFLTNGYTSAAGNTYFQGIRVSDRIAVKYLLGEGYRYTFLNGIQVYAYDGKQLKLIGSRAFNSYIFSEYNAKQETIGITFEYMKGQAKMIGAVVTDTQLNEFATKVVEGAYTQMKQLS